MVKLTRANVIGTRLRIEGEPDGTGAGRTKSGKWREVPLNLQAREALSALPDPPVSVHKNTLGDWFAVDARKAKVGGSRHRLRHTFCAHLVMAGVPLCPVQLLTGHSDYATTEKYYSHLAFSRQLRFRMRMKPAACGSGAVSYPNKNQSC